MNNQVNHEKTDVGARLFAFAIGMLVCAFIALMGGHVIHKAMTERTAREAELISELCGMLPYDQLHDMAIERLAHSKHIDCEDERAKFFSAVRANGQIEKAISELEKLP
jgi:hypothetical protein